MFIQTIRSSEKSRKKERKGKLCKVLYLFIQPFLISDQVEEIRNCVYLLPVEQPELCYFNYKVVVYF